MWHRCLFLILLSTVMTACTIPRQQRNCDEIAVAGLRRMFQKETSTDEIVTWASNTFHLPGQSIGVEPVNGQITWATQGAQYSATMDAKSLKGVNIRFLQRPPTAAEVVACIGTPEQYWAQLKRDVESFQMSLDLLQPSQGIVASGAKFYSGIPQKPPVIDETFPISTLNLVKPGALQQIFTLRDPYKPWPGTWKNVEIEVDQTLSFPTR